MSTSYWRLVSLVTFWHVVASLCYYAVYAGTPFLRDSFSLSGFEVGLVITSLTLGYAIFQIPVGIATDRFGERLTLTVGLLGLATGVLLLTIAPSYWLLLAATFVLGTAYGTATPGTNKAIFDNVVPERQHQAIGIKQIGPTIGSAISAVLVTGIAGVLFWQSGFLVVAAIGVATAGAFYLAYTGVNTVSSDPPDFRGLVANNAYVLLALAGACIGAGFYTTTGYTVLYVTESVGTTVAIAGVVLAVVQVFGSAGKVVAGWLADTLPGEPTTRIGTLLTVQALLGGVLFFAITTTDTPTGSMAVFSAVGLFSLGSTGLYYSCISTIVADDDIGAASAGGQFAVTSGGLFVPPLFGYLADTVGYDAGWIVLGTLSVVAAGLVALVVATSR